MAFYESVFIARQDVSAAQADALADRFTEIIQENGGQVARRENWGLKSLAFRIRKNRKGHYVMLNIEANGPAIAEMERNMRINEDIIRYLTVRVEKLDTEPSPMMKRGRDRDDDRGGRDRDDRGGRDRDDRGGRDRDDRGGGRRRDRDDDSRPREAKGDAE